MEINDIIQIDAYQFYGDSEETTDLEYRHATIYSQYFHGKPRNQYRGPSLSTVTGF